MTEQMPDEMPETLLLTVSGKDDCHHGALGVAKQQRL